MDAVSKTGFPQGFLAVGVALLLSSCGERVSTNVDVQVNVGNPALTLLDLAGNRVDPFEGEIEKAVVFLFVSVDCPISNRYAPTVRGLVEKFRSKGIRFLLVYPDPDTGTDAIEKHLREYAYPIKALRDPEHVLVVLAKARVTPDAAVFSSGKDLLYHGRIDNRFVDFGKERPAATHHDLEEVLTSISEETPVETISSPGVGCYIADLK